MNHLIICAHPNTNHSFNRAIVERVVDTSRQNNADTVVRDLYRLNFNPVLSWEELQGSFRGIIAAEIKHEQQFILEADLITLVYPLWWMGFPAILKGYLDRVLTHGFAYRTDETGSCGLLSNKKLQQFITMGNNSERYRQLGFAESLEHTLVSGLFNYVGITDIQHSFLGDIHIIDDQARKALLEEVEQKTRQNLTALTGKA
ncbi:putative NADPH-quinone reductase [Mesocricetibacter intestinalis]|uniref:Putative NADPH-quinone reductase n=1 Tax=Mesocricetibacter intestinalis TaxID=1521930 RepID=A0A4R6VB01_9PAST|nr:NAD(P)H-dependent oxidoreductase [Mesocricetibacter intestinalis]TDQ57197.1 putative NADPH-quinone reductase [Mesocricetibacter intestinalis]